MLHGAAPQPPWVAGPDGPPAGVSASRSVAEPHPSAYADPQAQYDQPAAPESPFADPYEPAGSDYDLYWSIGDLEIPVPNWIADLLEVPLRDVVLIMLFGFIIGLAVAACAFLIGMYAAYE